MDVVELFGCDSRMLVRWVVEQSPGDQPQESERAGDKEYRPPATEVMVEEQDDEWSHGPADGRAAVEERNRPGPFLRRKPLGDRLGRARPVRAFTHSEQEPEDPEARDGLC